MGGLSEVGLFWVDGDPIPQGSKTAYVVNGRAVLADANSKKLKPWRKAIATAAAAEFVGHPKLVGPVVVHVEFRFVRGKTVKRDHPSVKPDVDKLLRAVLDGVTDSGVWADDAQVVTLRGHKVYADRAGALVRVGALGEGAGQ